MPSLKALLLTNDPTTTAAAATAVVAIDAAASPRRRGGRDRIRLSNHRLRRKFVQRARQRRFLDGALPARRCPLRRRAVLRTLSSRHTRRTNARRHRRTIPGRRVRQFRRGQSRGHRAGLRLLPPRRERWREGDVEVERE